VRDVAEGLDLEVLLGLAAGPVDGELDLLPGAAHADLAQEIAEADASAAVDGDDLVAGPEPGFVGGGAGETPADLGRPLHHPLAEDVGEADPAEDQAHDHAGG